MKAHEVRDGGKEIHVTATTRAGLLSAALQGLMESSGSRTSEMEEQKIERPFALEADDFGELLTKLLDQALAKAAEHQEAYEDISFTLITDKKAQGAYVGKPAVGFSSPKKGVVVAGDVVKNAAGEWEATLKIK